MSLAEVPHSMQKHQDTNVLRSSPAMINPDSKVHGISMGPTWVLSAPRGPHVGSINIAIRENDEDEKEEESGGDRKVFFFIFSPIIYYYLPYMLHISF